MIKNEYRQKVYLLLVFVLASLAFGYFTVSPIMAENTDINVSAIQGDYHKQENDEKPTIEKKPTVIDKKKIVLPKTGKNISIVIYSLSVLMIAVYLIKLRKIGNEL